MSTDLQPANQTPTPTTPENPADDLVARAGRYYRNTRYIMVAVCIGLGLWFGYDGFVGWPQGNARLAAFDRDIKQAQEAGNQKLADELGAKKKESGLTFRSDTDLLIQKLLCFALPPLGIAYLAWTLYNSRGEIRLTDETLYAPGHPPVPLEAIKSLDDSKWDRKGIAYADYELPGGKAGSIRLDDFVYDRPPIDAIHDRIAARLAPEGGTSEADSAEATGETNAGPASEAASEPAQAGPSPDGLPDARPVKPDEPAGNERA